MKHKKDTITFIDNKGNMIELNARQTLGELVKSGANVQSIRIVPADTPIQDNEWRSVAPDEFPFKDIPDEKIVNAMTNVIKHLHSVHKIHFRRIAELMNLPEITIKNVLKS